MAGAGIVLLSGWLAWFVWALVPVRAVSQRARLEVISQSHPVETTVSGRVKAVHLELGRHVNAGDPLVEIDSQKIRLELEEENARYTAFQAQLEVLRQQVALEEEAVEQAHQAASAAVTEAKYLRKQAHATAKSAIKDARRIALLRDQGMVSTAEHEQSQSKAQSMDALAKSLQTKVASLSWKLGLTTVDRKAHLQESRKELAALEGQVHMSAVTMARLNKDLDDHTVRAPVSGRIGQVLKPQIGSLLQQYARVATIIPAGEVRVVADFAPADALARIRPGQTARMRLHGFPWSQYGSIPATVTHVAAEVHEGWIRVEMVVNEPDTVIAPMEHGLTGIVEIDLEHISPAVVVFRAAGALLARPAKVDP